jgi:peptide/nickel transport system ATP-binding protein
MYAGRIVEEASIDILSRHPYTPRCCWAGRPKDGLKKATRCTASPVRRRIFLAAGLRVADALSACETRLSANSTRDRTGRPRHVVSCHRWRELTPAVEKPARYA